MANSRNLDVETTESNHSFTIHPFSFELDQFTQEDNGLEQSNLDELAFPTPIHNESQIFHSKPDPDSIKMFVGQIPKTFTESDLLVMFERFGKVYELWLLKDKTTGRSKGCCFVTFFTRQAALDAQNALHNVKVLPGMHHPIQMKPADTEKRNDRKVFIGMLPKHYSENDVRTVFSPYGTIEECTVLRHPDRRSKGCAFVTYTTRQNAANAVKSMHGSHTFKGCSSPIVVKFADTQKEKETRRMSHIQNNQCENSSISYFLQQLSLAATANLVATNNLIQQLEKSGNSIMGSQASDSVMNQLKKLTAQLSRPDDGLQTNEELLNQLIDSHNGLNGTISLINHLTQLTSKTDLENHAHDIVRNVFQNSPYCREVQRTPYQWDSPSHKQIEGPDGANLFVYHLPQGFTDQNLADLFRPYGNIISAKVFTDQITKVTKTFGFVSYARVESARAAMQSLNGYSILGKKLKVELKKSKLNSRYYLLEL